jgi:hypothetical protein
MTARRADVRRVLAVATAAALAWAVVGCDGDGPTAAPSRTPVTPAITTTPSASTVAPTSAAPPAAIPAGSAAPVTGAYTPRIDPAAFGTTVENPLFPLRPGMRWEYRSNTEDGVETTVVVVTNRLRGVMGIPCIEVRDTVRLDGVIIEDTLDWYAQQRDGTVWYFGEDTKEYEDGKVVSTKGSWEAGVRGALPGIVMPAQPRVGDRYRQEYYRGEAEDIAEVLSVVERVRVPVGSYSGVVKTKDTTPLEPQVLEHKYFARGIGPVLTVDVASGGVRDELVLFRE